jgi:hypothetical protein
MSTAGRLLMGIMDKAKDLRNKLTESGKADELIDKGREKLDQATGHRYGDKLEQGAQRVKDATRKRPEQAGDTSPGQHHEARPDGGSGDQR